MRGLPVRHLNWLSCDSSAHKVLLPTWKKFMGRIPFKPHLTLIGDLHSTAPLETPLSATITSIATSKHPYQCLAAKIDYSKPLQEFLNQYGLYTPFFPHVSLAYFLPIRIAHSTKSRLSWLTGYEIVFDALWQIPVTPSMKFWRPLYGA